jgi:A/G-specific adenine glycosylase
MSDEYNYQEIVPYLLDWFDLNARILTWREEPTPYHVWVSEIMLQQTRVEAVKRYYERFLDALPTIKDLANATEDELLKLWEGLGYYSRVRNLQKAAIIIENEYGGELPDTYEELLKLPGIGTYTAGAIASMAFGIPIAAVDGNVFRIAKRLAGSFDDITKGSVKKEMEVIFTSITPKERAGAFNQSLMDFGATVCIPNGKPLCGQCPLSHLCLAFKRDQQMMIPVKPAKKARRVEEKTVLLIEYQKRYVIHKREAKGLLSGMWEIPNIEGFHSIDYLEDNYKLNRIAEVTRIGEYKHIFSHVEWSMVGYLIHVKSKAGLRRIIKRLSGDSTTIYELADSKEVLSNSSIIREGNYSEKEEQNESSSDKNSLYLITSLEELKGQYAIPSAFDAFKLWEKKPS